MTNKIYVAASLDGFIAEADGGLDWLNQIPNPAQSDFGFAEFMDTVDALIMGRYTFEKVLEFGEWPYNKPVFVLSSKRIEIPTPLENKVELMHGDVLNVVKVLNSKGFMDLYVDGGKTIQEFLKRDLIDEMVLTWVSIILGDGIPLFGNIGSKRKFKLIKTEMLNEYLVKQHYVSNNGLQEDS